MENSWIYVPNDFTIDMLVNRLWPTQENAQDIGLIFDLDDTLTDSPARRTFDEYLKRDWRRRLYPTVLASGAKRFFGGKNADSKIWKTILSKYLENDAGIKSFMEANFTPDKVKFYEEFHEFMDYFPAQTPRYIVSRINGKIGEGYKIAGGFTGLKTLQFNKKKALDEILKERPELRRLVIFGDSKVDLELFEYAKLIKGRDNVTGICVSGLPYSSVEDDRSKLMPGFDIYMGRSYRGIRELMALLRTYVKSDKVEDHYTPLMKGELIKVG